jgi:hypothetical protein
MTTRGQIFQFRPNDHHARVRIPEYWGHRRWTSLPFAAGIRANPGGPRSTPSCALGGQFLDRPAELQSGLCAQLFLDHQGTGGELDGWMRRLGTISGRRLDRPAIRGACLGKFRNSGGRRSGPQVGDAPSTMRHSPPPVACLATEISPDASDYCELINLQDAFEERVICWVSE